METIYIPEKVERIRAMVFSRCKNLKHIHLTQNINTIDRWAFSDSPDLIIYAPAGSYAETYAKENNIPFEAE